MRQRLQPYVLRCRRELHRAATVRDGVGLLCLRARRRRRARGGGRLALILTQTPTVP